jgi:hypothetical protein
MADDPRPEDWELLDIAPGASREEIDRAYQRRRALYAPGALASYSLYDRQDRTDLLDGIDEAYRRISEAHRETEPTETQTPEVVAVPDGPAPDFREQPGAFLHHSRTMRGVSVDDLAEETKIRASLLAIVENEEFSALPAEVYVRGFVVQYAKALDLSDPEGLANAYLLKMRQTASRQD